MKSNFEINDKVLLLSCFEASRAWVAGEREDVQSFRKKSSDGLSESEFHRFLIRWRVMRNSLPSRRSDLLRLLCDEAPRLESGTEVKKLAEKAQDKEMTTMSSNGNRILPTSLISKVAFCINPQIFAPMDTLSNRGIKRTVGTSVDRHDYPKYLEEFKKVHDKVSCHLTKKSWTSATFKFGDKEDNVLTEIFSRRVTDKYLMLFGSFGGNNPKQDELDVLERSILATRNTFSDEAYKMLTGQ